MEKLKKALSGRDDDEERGIVAEVSFPTRGAGVHYTEYIQKVTVTVSNIRSIRKQQVGLQQVKYPGGDH